jgi:hypothetical protein
MPTITGITRDYNGDVLIGAAVRAFLTSNDTLAGADVSNGFGEFAVTVATGGEHYLVCYKDGSPDVHGISVNTLIGAPD